MNVEIGKQYEVDLYFGTSGIKTVTVTVEDLDHKGFANIAFPHPTVRRFVARQTIAVNRLREILQ